MALNKQLFFHEVAALRRSTIIWTVGLVGLSVGFLCLFPLFASDVSVAKEVIDKFPPAFKDAFNIAADTLATVPGFFSYLFNFILLAGAIQALNLGLRELSKEESGKTVDFLLAKPLSRVDIVTSKLLAALSSLLVVNVIFIGASIITALAISDAPFDKSTLLLVAGSLILVQLLFMTLGFLLSTILKRVKSPISLSMPIVFTFFIIGALGSAVGNINVALLTPFKFFDSAYILDHSAYDVKYVILTLILLSIGIFFTYYLYHKRDVRSV